MSQVTNPLLLDGTFRTKLDALTGGVNAIAAAIGGVDSLHTWAEFQDMIKHGYGERLYPAGTEIAFENTPPLIVMGHNIYKNPDDADAPTCTLLFKDVFINLQYDEREFTGYAEAEMPAGTYHFKYDNNYYQFTTTKVIPQGGGWQIEWQRYASDSITDHSVLTYADRYSGVLETTGHISAGSAGNESGITSSINKEHSLLALY